MNVISKIIRIVFTISLYISSLSANAFVSSDQFSNTKALEDSSCKLMLIVVKGDLNNCKEIERYGGDVNECWMVYNKALIACKEACEFEEYRCEML